MSPESVLTCPECGTHNRPGSVFCAECGARLSLDHGDDANPTVSFTPITDTRDRTAESWTADDTGTTQIFAPRVDPGDAASTPIDMSPWAAPLQAEPTTYAREPGRRGFVLGVIATLLILIVFGFFLWSTVASDGFRDAVTGLF